MGSCSFLVLERKCQGAPRVKEGLYAIRPEQSTLVSTQKTQLDQVSVPPGLPADLCLYTIARRLVCEPFDHGPALGAYRGRFISFKQVVPTDHADSTDTTAISAGLYTRRGDV